MFFSAAISSFALDLRSQWSPGAVCSCLRHLRPFYCISLKKYMRGEYDRGISVGWSYKKSEWSVKKLTGSDIRTPFLIPYLSTTLKSNFNVFRPNHPTPLPYYCVISFPPYQLRNLPFLSPPIYFLMREWKKMF